LIEFVGFIEFIELIEFVGFIEFIELIEFVGFIELTYEPNQPDDAFCFITLLFQSEIPNPKSKYPHRAPLFLFSAFRIPTSAFRIPTSAFERPVPR
jgi:hypothetical protein